MLSQHLCAPPSHGPRTSHSSCQGSGKEVRPHPLSYWCVQMSTGPALCSFTAICSCLLSTWCPEMAPVQGMLLGCRGCSWVQNQQQGAGGEEVLLPICIGTYMRVDQFSSVTQSCPTLCDPMARQKVKPWVLVRKSESR